MNLGVITREPTHLKSLNLFALSSQYQSQDSPLISKTIPQRFMSDKNEVGWKCASRFLSICSQAK